MSRNGSRSPFDVDSFCAALDEALKPYSPELIESDGYALEGSGRPWREWVAIHFPHVATKPFAARHERLHEWFDAIEPDVKPLAAVEIWPRGGAKSSTGEIGCARVGAKLSRRFCLYVSSTQDQADKHVQSVGVNFERMGIGRAVNRYGHSKGWRRDQLRTENGFNVASLGLDAAMRGIKLDNFRPDLIIFDDVDGRHDSPATTAKKIATITESILPAGSSDCAVLFLQNLIIKDGIVGQLVDGRADFLRRRTVSPIEPAVYNLTYEATPGENGLIYWRITGGTASWAGQDLTTCEAQLNEWGKSAFLREAQHRVEEEAGLWDRQRDIDAHRVTEHPALIRIAVSVDPSITTNGDEAGILVGGVAIEAPGGVKSAVYHAYVLADYSIQGSPLTWATQAVTAYRKERATLLVAEANQGGEMVSTTIATIPKAPPVVLVHASQGKRTRAEPVHAEYEVGRVHHVGEFPALESEMCTWQQGDPSPNRMDALVWLITKLLLSGTNGNYVAGGQRSAVGAIGQQQARLNRNGLRG